MLIGTVAIGVNYGIAVPGEREEHRLTEPELGPDHDVGDHRGELNRRGEAAPLQQLADARDEATRQRFRAGIDGARGLMAAYRRSSWNDGAARSGHHQQLLRRLPRWSRSLMPVAEEQPCPERDNEGSAQESEPWRCEKPIEAKAAGRSAAICRQPESRGSPRRCPMRTPAQGVLSRGSIRAEAVARSTVASDNTSPPSCHRSPRRVCSATGASGCVCMVSPFTEYVPR